MLATGSGSFSVQAAMRRRQSGVRDSPAPVRSFTTEVSLMSAAAVPLPPFKAGSSFTVGVEEELHIVATDTRATRLVTDAPLAKHCPTAPGGADSATA